MEQLQQVAALDPEAQKLLMEDLAKTHPALWKPLMERFRAALEYHRRLEQSSSSKRVAGLRMGSASQENQENSEEDTSVHNRAGRASAAGAATEGQKSETIAGSNRSSSSADNLGADTRKETSADGAGSAQGQSVPGGHQDKASSSKLAATAYLSSVQDDSASAEKTRDSTEASRMPSQPMASLPPPTLSGAGTGGPMEFLTTLPGPGGGSTSSGTSTLQQTAISSTPVAPARRATSPEQSSASLRANWREQLGGLLRQMQTRLPASPQTDEEIAGHVYYRLLCLAAGRTEEALEPIPGVPPAMQDFWANQLYGIHVLLDGHQIPDRRQRAAEAKRLFQEATNKLAMATPLVVKGLAFATEVQSFGCYAGFEKYEFQPAQEVLLYAEVENFQSQPTPKGYHTKLRSRFQILNADGQPVYEQEFPITEEYCRHIRRDFFIAYPVRLPEDLPPGRYTLKLSLEDLYRAEVCQASIEFTIRKK
ncbi:MAG: hypothetical protein NZ602_06200 [Thermoguttaceae bacterium]|nr:hypothetical protein [Thermoguttaceae bacterium]MDW8037980.1 hypothetical protein [Thermoguttaceae bacterium]